MGGNVHSSSILLKGDRISRGKIQKFLKTGKWSEKKGEKMKVTYKYYQLSVLR